MDGYDKLKAFGFCVHGAIDGYSSRILLPEVSMTNNDPSVIAQYFITCVRGVRSVPRIIRADCGTENVNVAAIQRFLRRDCEDAFSGFKSFFSGKSYQIKELRSGGRHFVGPTLTGELIFLKTCVTWEFTMMEIHYRLSVCAIIS